MSIRDAFNKALESLKLKSKLMDEKSSSSSSSSSKRIVPRYPELDDNDPPQGGSGVPDKNGIAMEYLDNKALLKDDKCDECDLKKKQVIKETKEDAIKKVFEDLSKLTKEEFQAELDKHKPEPTHAEKAEKEIKEYFVPKHLRDYAQDVRDHVAAKKAEPKKYDKDKCDPKTCWGECQGEGWCHIAQEWQQKIHHYSFVKYVKVKNKRGKMSKKKRQELKRKWQQRHKR